MICVVASTSSYLTSVGSGVVSGMASYNEQMKKTTWFYNASTMICMVASCSSSMVGGVVLGMASYSEQMKRNDFTMHQQWYVWWPRACRAWTGALCQEWPHIMNK